MVEKKLSVVAAEIEGTANEAAALEARADLSDQITELKAEIARLSETVSAIGSGARAVVTTEAEAVAERVRERVREEPVSTLLAVAGASFVLGLLARR
ncbi:hypothetical protein [Pararhizobium sp.]|uniref:hypothetical protein n=1 Tax=Pararhizobium sp. TaxID=1977563 RepID=UPI00271AD1BB|nr:hypothetical protein [Pararhizobium sp.]MDO9417327.1 hypothetical protein [Pararhizobium sp.]